MTLLHLAEYVNIVPMSATVRCNKGNVFVYLSMCYGGLDVCFLSTLNIGFTQVQLICIMDEKLCNHDCICKCQKMICIVGNKGFLFINLFVTEYINIVRRIVFME